MSEKSLKTGRLIRFDEGADGARLDVKSRDARRQRAAELHGQHTTIAGLAVRKLFVILRRRALC